MSDFHEIIQATMGWTNSHLHLFSDGKNEYSPSGLMEEGAKEYESVRLDEMLKTEKSKIVYEYDFGDSWEHSILLEKILPPDSQLKLPKCIAGKRNCPLEDCDGVVGYSYMLEVLKLPDHEDYEHYSEWLGDEFDPEYFDKNEINEWLN